MRVCLDRMVLTQANGQLRYEMRHIVRRDWLEIGRCLYEVHGDYLRAEGFNVRYMEQGLQTQSSYEPECEDELGSENVHDHEAFYSTR